MSGQSSEPEARFEVPLYRMAEAAKYLGVPTATFVTWAKGYVRQPPDRPVVKAQPIVTALPSRGRNYPTIPFIGLAEGMVLAALRSKGVPLQRIRPAVAVLAQTIGLGHALASKALYTDGAEVLYDYAEKQVTARRPQTHVSWSSCETTSACSPRSSWTTSSVSSTGQTVTRG